VDAYSTAGVGLAFVIQIIIQRTPFAWLTPYIDPGIAVVMAVILLWEPITMIYDAVRSLILAAPKEEMREEIRNIIESELKEHKLQIDFLDIVRTGRRIWIDVYIIPQGRMLDLKALKKVQDESMNILNGKYEEDIFVEMIPELNKLD